MTHKKTTGRFWFLLAINVFLAIGLFTSQTNQAAGLWAVGLMVAMMLLGVSVGIALSLASVAGLFHVSSTAAVVNVLSSAPFSASSKWSMSVLPMFILMGFLLTQAGLTQRLYRATYIWFGWLPGGLAIGTTAAGAGLSAVSGSTIGMTYTLGRAGIPEMLKVGYDRRVAVGSILTGGLAGQLIPPSIILVVYAGVVSVPVGPQLLAGVVPGLAISAMFALLFLALGLVFPKLMGRGKDAPTAQRDISWRERFTSILGLWGLPLIMLVLFGGLFTGYFTPTEAGAAAAFMSVLLTMYYTRRSQPVHQIAKALVQTARATAAIFLILIGAEMLTRMLAVTGIAGTVTDFIVELGLPRFGFLVALIIFYIFLGMFFDTMSMILLTVPLLMPALDFYDVNLIWFGVFIVILGEIGMITPPVGVLAYITYNLTKDREINQGVKITLNDVFMAILWFLPFAVLFLIILIFWPDLATWLPSISSAT
ncbi:TRAP transporter large permease [Dietzia natronolimnaea]|uniref:TRAP transporter large permease subunit n=1 Tax=Dietzia natronolimnaea TaxID=161920 RepID=UPI0015F9C443|nr:TRAP transporter large permease [Dietzia natronolimnaea]